MKITRITYGESYEAINSYGLKSWNKLGVEIEMEAGDSADEAYKTAHQFIKEKLTKQIEEEPVIQKKNEPKLTGFAHWENEINKCTTIEKPDGIESFRAIADMNPKLKEVFNNRLNELKNGLE